MRVPLAQPMPKVNFYDTIFFYQKLSAISLRKYETSPILGTLYEVPETPKEWKPVSVSGWVS